MTRTTKGVLIWVTLAAALIATLVGWKLLRQPEWTVITDSPDDYVVTVQHWSPQLADDIASQLFQGVPEHLTFHCAGTGRTIATGEYAGAWSPWVSQYVAPEAATCQ